MKTYRPMALWACDVMNNCSANGYFPFGKTSMNIIQAKIPKSHLQKAKFGYHDGKFLVYLLAQDGEVTYVGSTEGNFSNRYSDHCKSVEFGDKSTFNEVYLIEADVFELDELEKLMIGFFNPKDNQKNKGEVKLFARIYDFFAGKVNQKKKFEIQNTLENLVKKHFIGKRSLVQPHFEFLDYNSETKKFSWGGVDLQFYIDWGLCSNNNVDKSNNLL